MLVSLFVGGYATGKMYKARSRNYLNWHGFLTWCAFTALSFFLLTTSIGKLMSGAANVTGGTPQSAAPLAPDISTITREALVNTLTRQTGMSRSEADRKIDAWGASYQNIREEARVKADEAARAPAPAKDKEPDFVVKKGRGLAAA